MDENERIEDKQENFSKSGLSPFKSAMYRTLWIAALFSYVGAAMYDVGASWLMTSLSPDPLFVSLITTATALPILCLLLIHSRNLEQRKVHLLPCSVQCLGSARFSAYFDVSP